MSTLKITVIFSDIKQSFHGDKRQKVYKRNSFSQTSCWLSLPFNHFKMENITVNGGSYLVLVKPIFPDPILIPRHSVLTWRRLAAPRSASRFRKCEGEKACRSDPRWLSSLNNHRPPRFLRGFAAETFIRGDTGVRSQLWIKPGSRIPSGPNVECAKPGVFVWFWATNHPQERETGGIFGVFDISLWLIFREQNTFMTHKWMDGFKSSGWKAAKCFFSSQPSSAAFMWTFSFHRKWLPS